MRLHQSLKGRRTNHPPQCCVRSAGCLERGLSSAREACWSKAPAESVAAGTGKAREKGVSTHAHGEAVTPGVQSQHSIPCRWLKCAKQGDRESPRARRWRARGRDSRSRWARHRRANPPAGFGPKPSSRRRIGWKTREVRSTPADVGSLQVREDRSRVQAALGYLAKHQDVKSSTTKGPQGLVGEFTRRRSRIGKSCRRGVSGASGFVR